MGTNNTIMYLDEYTYPCFGSELYPFIHLQDVDIMDEGDLPPEQQQGVMGYHRALPNENLAGCNFLAEQQPGTLVFPYAEID